MLENLGEKMHHFSGEFFGTTLSGEKPESVRTLFLCTGKVILGLHQTGHVLAKPPRLSY